jgi:hypothetical protein
MADLFDRLTYQPVQTTAPSGVPSIDFAAGREAVRTQETFTNAMNRIADFAFKDAQRTAQIRGGMAGAEDPRGTLLDLQGRDPATLNIPEAAAYEAAVKGLSTQIQVEAKSVMGREYLESMKLGETPDQLADRLDAVTVGYSDVVGMLSPEAAQNVTLRLDDQRNAHYLNFSEDYLKKERVKARAVGASQLEEMNFAIEDMARSTLGDIDKYIDESANNIYEMLIGQEYSEEEAANEVLKAKRRAHTARLNGAYDRLETIEEKMQFADDLADSIGDEGGLARGLPDANAEALANKFKLAATREQSALNGEISNLGQDIQTNVLNIVSSAGIPSQQTIKDINSRIAALEEAGADKGRIAELKEAVTMAEENIDYLRNVKDFNLDQLQAEHDRLESAIVEEEMATPSDMMRFKIIKSKLSSAVSEANAQNTAWGKSATAIGQKIDNIQKIVDDFNPVDPAMFELIGQDIEALRESGAPDELVDALNAEFQIMSGRSKMFNDLADDTALELEAKLNKFRTEAREDGYTVSENEIINLIEGRLTAMTTALNKDPLSWANGSGVITLDQSLMMMALNPDFDPLSPEVQGVVQQRRQDANAVVSHYGTQRRLLTDSEGEQLANAIVDADPQLQMAYLMRVNQVFGVDTVEALAALNKQAPVLAHMGGLMVDQTSPKVMDRMIVGRKIKDGMEDRAYGELTDMREKNITTFGGLTETPGVAKFVDNAKKIADYYYLGMGGSSSGSFDDDLYEDAIQYATGMVEIGSKRFGGIVTYNDTQVILPNNIPQDGIDKIMEFTKEEDFFKLAVVQDQETGELLPYDKMPVGAVNNQAFSLGDISRYRLITVGDGIYKLRHPSSPETMFTPDGFPYLIDLKRYKP